MDRHAYVYMLASRRNGTLYVGCTANLQQRVWQHRLKAVPGFTAAHEVTRLVWYELHGDLAEALLREKRLKRWRRAWKLALIEAMNPTWRDLYEEIGP